MRTEIAPGAAAAQIASRPAAMAFVLSVYVLAFVLVIPPPVLLVLKKMRLSVHCDDTLEM